MGFFGDLVSAGANLAMNSETNSTNRRIARETNEANIQMNDATNRSNSDIARMNNEMSYKIANEANAFNRETQQMTNEFNAAEAEKARQFQLDMWNETFEKQNEYNDPSAQVARLRAAGLNPTLMMQGGSSGSVSSGGSTGSGAAASAGSNIGAVTPDLTTSFNQAGHVSPYYNTAPQIAQLGGALEDANLIFGMINQNKLTNAQLEQMDKQNALMGAQALKLFGDTNWHKTTSTYRDFMTDPSTVIGRAANELNLEDQQLFNMRAENRLVNAQQLNLNLMSAEKASYLNHYFDAAQQLDLALRASGVLEKMLAGEVSKAEVKKLTQDCVESEARTAGIKLNNKVQEGISDILLDAMKEQQEYYKNYYEDLKDPSQIKRSRRIDNWTRAIQPIAGLLGGAAAIATPIGRMRMAAGNSIGAVNPYSYSNGFSY